MTIWEKISLFFCALNPLHYYEFEDVVLCKPIYVFVTIVTLAPLFVQYNWNYKVAPAEAPKEYVITKHYDLYGETVRWTNKETEKQAIVLKTLSRGEKVSVIGYSDIDSLFWVHVIFGLVLLCLALCVVYVYATCVFIFLPMLIHRIGGLKRFPYMLYKLIMCVAMVYSAFLVYWQWGGLPWWGVIILAVIMVRAIMLWNKWISLNLCYEYNSFYT